MRNFESKLNPLPIAISALTELNSDDFLHIIHRSGVSIDLTLNEDESFSHKTRLRVYIPRLNNAIRELSDLEALHVIYLIFMNISDKFPEKHSEIEERLKQIGWELIKGQLNPRRKEIIELYFKKGLVHDAYVSIRKIIEKATSEIAIIDPYIDRSLFEFLKNVSNTKTIHIKVLTKDKISDFDHELSLFNCQFPNLNVEKHVTEDFHDRFIIVDNIRVYHIGASIKDAGKKVFIINEIKDYKNKDSILKSFNDAWNK